MDNMYFFFSIVFLLILSNLPLNQAWNMVLRVLKLNTNISSLVEMSWRFAVVGFLLDMCFFFIYKNSSPHFLQFSTKLSLEDGIERA